MAVIYGMSHPARLDFQLWQTTAVLIYGAIRSPLAQSRNLIGGHVISAIIGVTAHQWMGGSPWLDHSAVLPSLY